MSHSITPERPMEVSRPQRDDTPELILTSRLQKMFDDLEERCLTRIEARLSKFERKSASGRPHSQKSVGDRLAKYHRSPDTPERERPSPDYRSRNDRDRNPKENHSAARKPDEGSRRNPERQTPELRSEERSAADDRHQRSRSTSSGRYSRFMTETNEKPTVKSVVRQVTYRSRMANELKFRTVLDKLTTQSNFKMWKRKVLGSIDEQDCGFVVDKDKSLPSQFSEDEIPLVTKKVKYFIESCLDDYHCNLMGESDHPREMLSMLSRMFQPTTTHHQTSVFDRFNSMQYDPAAEKPVEFISRFNDALKDVTFINPRLANDEYVRETFLVAIRNSTTYDRVRLSTRDFNLTDLKLMLIDDEIQEQQHGNRAENRALNVRLVSSYGRGGKFRGRGGGRGRGGIKKNKLGRSFPKSSAAQDQQMRRPTIPKAEKECSFCHKKGHVASSCFKARKTCFNCDQRGHIARDCPKPLSARLQNLTRPSEMRFAQSQEKRRAMKPELIKMKLGQAKLLQKRYEKDEEAAFLITGNKEADDDAEVWVVIGQNEKRSKDVSNYLEETGAALQSSEGEWN